MERRIRPHGSEVVRFGLAESAGEAGQETRVEENHTLGGHPNRAEFQKGALAFGIGRPRARCGDWFNERFSKQHLPQGHPQPVETEGLHAT